MVRQAHHRQVVIFIAPPGSGKGTQSDILAEKFGFLHLETSKIIEEKFNKASPDDEEILKEKKNFASGELVDPVKVTAWVIEKIRELAADGVSIVFSGSFRTLYEAEQELPVVEELYGKDHITIFFIGLSEEESVIRNSNRRLCEKNRHPIPNTPEFATTTVCPQDGSPLIKRTLDTPEVARERYQVYLRRTQPVLEYIRQRGYQLIEIDGERGIDAVTHDILQNFKAD